VAILTRAPVRADGRRTPQPTPGLIETTHLSPVGVMSRLSNLRARCLLRDHHRCVITRKFDMIEAERRVECDGYGASDDDGSLLRDEKEAPTFLEVSHIIPHSFMCMGANETELVRAAKTRSLTGSTDQLSE
jgi:hypothetical protein